MTEIMWVTHLSKQWQLSGNSDDWGQTTIADLQMLCFCACLLVLMHISFKINLT